MAHTAPAHNVHVGAEDSRSGEGGCEHMGALSSLQPHTSWETLWGLSLTHTEHFVFPLSNSTSQAVPGVLRPGWSWEGKQRATKGFSLFLSLALFFYFYFFFK